MIHILNFYLGRTKDRNNLKKINPLGKSFTADAQVVLMVDVESNKIAAHKWSIREPLTHEVDSLKIAEWEQKQMERIVNCVLARASEMDKRIAHAIGWYSKAVNSNDTEEQFLSLAIVLESLLIGKDEDNTNTTQGSISQRLAERVAYLLGKNYVRRKAYVKETKLLYGLCSRIVHSGESVTSEQLESLEDIAWNIIYNLASQDFQTWPRFAEWLDHQKYMLPGDEMPNE